MAEREEEADRDRTLTFLHQLARDVVDGRDVIGIDGVAQPEPVRQQRGAEQQRLIAEHQEGPEPGRDVAEE